MESLWKDMDKGGFSTILRKKIAQFNGGLFSECSALPLNQDQLELLLEAAKFNWADVEPAIFGTLLERALDPVERHKLGAHYTPRAYVERLVIPTIMEPLREEWDDVYATATALYNSEKVSEAQKSVRDFHEKLCHIRVRDPSAVSGLKTEAATVKLRLPSPFSHFGIEPNAINLTSTDRSLSTTKTTAKQQIPPTDSAEDPFK